VKKKRESNAQALSPSEQRAARSERVKVFEAEPFGWIAFSESGAEREYRLYLNPETKHLVCTCADYIFRGNDDPYFECKHVSATLKFIARRYLVNEYHPQRRVRQAA
jgi:predicted nucleic acid-binding Zn finger protein